MKVAMVSEHASPLTAVGGVDAGGQNIHVAALSESLARTGNQVTVYTRRDDRFLPRRVKMCPGVWVEHVDAGPPRSIPKDDMLPHMGAFADRLRHAWDAERPDVVHAHFWMSGLASLDAAGPLDIPVVETFHALGVVKRRHQGDADTSPHVRIGLEQRILQEAAHIVATCTDEVFELARLGGDPSRVSVVPCGVDVSLFRPTGPAWSRGRGPHRLLAVGRLVERKGLDDAITALAELPDAELLIAGGPPCDDLDDDTDARRLLATAQAHGVSERVKLLGRVSRSDLPALIRSSDAVICVPWYEPFGIVPLEAMACGVPVVASTVGGLVDTVVDGVTGIHVPPRDPPRLASALRRLLADPGLMSSLGAAGVQRVQRRYRWDRVAASTRSVYQEVLESNRNRARAVTR